MREEFAGTVHRFGKNIDTDQIYPGRYLELVEPEEIARHCLEGADAEFALRVAPGDIVVATTNFGCGSSREHAAIALKNARVGLVIAESFARIFYRNAINLALPLLICKGAGELINADDTVRANLTTGLVENLTTGESLTGEPLSAFALKIVEAGGIKAIFRERCPQGF